MNRIILLAAFLLPAFGSIAQYQYEPIPTKGATWVYRYDYPDQGNAIIKDWQLMMNGEDTIINGVTYTKIMYRSTNARLNDFSLSNEIANAPDSYYGAFRETNKKTYIIRSSDNTETLLYNFNISMSNPYPESSQMWYKVIASDTVFVANKYRRRFVLSTASAPFPDSITEGYGGEYGLENRLKIMAGGQQAYFSFLSFHYADEYYCSPSCTYIFPYGTPTSVNTVSKDETNIYPNPFTDELKINISQPCTSTLYNALGIYVSKENISAGVHTIGTASLPPGLYFITLKNDQGEIILTQKLQKQ